MSDAAVDERILALRDEPFNAALGSRKTWRLLNAQDGRPPVARCTVERRMRALGLSGAAPGRKPRATGPAEGDRAPGDLLRRDFTATGPNRRWVVDLRPRADPVGVLVARRSSWTCTPAASSVGHQRAHGAPTTRAAPWNTRSRRARNAGARTWRGWCTTATTDRSTCPSPTPDDSSKRGPGASAGAVGSSYDNAAAEALNKSYKRELVWRDGPWKGRADPGNRDRQMGGLVQPHPPPPHQRRRPPTHNRRTPLQSQPHHHPTHHITTQDDPIDRFRRSRQRCNGAQPRFFYRLGLPTNWTS